MGLAGTTGRHGLRRLAAHFCTTSRFHPLRIASGGERLRRLRRTAALRTPGDVMRATLGPQNRPGEPFVNRPEAKRVMLKTRVSEGFREVLNSRAIALGVSTSEYVRRAVIEALAANK